MIDINHINSIDSRMTFFGSPNQSGTLGGNSWQVWNKPRGCKMVAAMCVGGGGGGGGGCTNTSNFGTLWNGAGGPGGGAGGMALGMWPAFFLPDVLYINIGAGGSGGTNGIFSATNGMAGQTASAGWPTRISIVPTTATVEVNLLMARGGGGGGGASGSAQSVAGSGGIATSSDCPLGQIGTFQRNVMSSGSLGGTAASPGTTLSLLTFPILGGTVGGNSRNGPQILNGGSISGSQGLSTAVSLGSSLMTLSGAFVSSTWNGRSGQFIFPYIYGGTGASGNGNGNCESGGNGFMGSGGGGGGGARWQNFAPTGSGGTGGDGWAIIWAW